MKNLINTKNFDDGNEKAHRCDFKKIRIDDALKNKISVSSVELEGVTGRGATLLDTFESFCVKIHEYNTMLKKIEVENNKIIFDCDELNQYFEDMACKCAVSRNNLNFVFSKCRSTDNGHTLETNISMEQIDRIISRMNCEISG